MNHSTYLLLATIPSRVVHINSFDPYNSPVMGAAIIPLRMIPIPSPNARTKAQRHECSHSLDCSVLLHALETHLVTVFIALFDWNSQ